MTDRQSILDAIAVYDRQAGAFAASALKDADMLCTSILAAIEDEDCTGLTFAAHSLKSVMRQAGANALADTAQELEALGKSRKIKAAAALAGQLRAQQAETAAVLSAVILASES